VNLRTSVVVASRVPLTSGVLELHLRGVDGAVLPNWSPGAHIGLHLPNGMVREYSLVSDPTDCTRWVVAVAREPRSRGGSAFVHDQLATGSVIEVDGPKNHFLLEPAERFVLVAGGIGVTPLVPIADHLDLLGLEWTMLYSGRSRTEMAYVDRLCGRFGDQVTVHADDTAGGRPPLAAFLPDATGAGLVYCCGPEGLVSAVSEIVPADRLRVERFQAPARPERTKSSFEVVLAHSGQRIEVGGSESLLDALQRAGVQVPRSCTEGICGTCEVGVLDGEVDHRDFLLTPRERARHDVMMACVSRARTPRLRLDLPVVTVADYER
jgi:tetrachlorobenzoquinone reductase